MFTDNIYFVCLCPHSNMEQAQAHIWTLPYVRGATCTACGLKDMMQMFSSQYGDRTDIPNMAIVITDGISNTLKRQTLPRARQARNRGIIMYAVGIGRSASFHQELLGIVGNKRSHLIKVTNFASLKNKLGAVTATTCEGKGSFLPRGPQ